MSAPLDRHVRASSEERCRAAARGARTAASPLAVGGALLAGAIFLGVSDPYRPGGHLVCPLLVLTGLLCPACGGQRAVHDLVRLDLAGAWGMNPLVVLAVPLAVLLWVRWARRAWGRPAALPVGGPVDRPVARPVEAGPTTAWLVMVVVVTFAVLRNVPLLQPWLAP